MKARDPFSGSLFETHPASIASKSLEKPKIALAPPIDVGLELLVEVSSDEILRAVKRAGRQPDPESRFCMFHLKWESDVSIYIDGKRPLFLCPAEAEKRNAWKWEGEWPKAK